MMVVFLPGGRSIFNPGSIKLIKVLPNQTQSSTEYIVIIKLDDDSELMVNTFKSEQKAFSFADQCADAINAAENDEDCLSLLRELFTFLPLNNMEDPPVI